MTIELEGGSTPTEGNIKVNGKYICQDGWDSRDAAVVCRMLGLSGGIPMTRSTFGSAEGGHLFSEVDCVGTEDSLSSCNKSAAGSYCDEFAGAGVICQDNSKELIKLEGGSDNSEGNVFLLGKPVCASSWSIEDATVA